MPRKMESDAPGKSALAAVDKAAAAIGKEHGLAITAHQEGNDIALAIARPAAHAAQDTHEPIGIALAIVTDAGIAINGMQRCQGVADDTFWLLNATLAPTPATPSPTNDHA